jgi:hypothetical protein
MASVIVMCSYAPVLLCYVYIIARTGLYVKYWITPSLVPECDKRAFLFSHLLFDFQQPVFQHTDRCVDMASIFGPQHIKQGGNLCLDHIVVGQLINHHCQLRISVHQRSAH